MAVYFALSADGLSVKIGRSHDVEARRQQLECGEGEPVKIIGFIAGAGHSLERILHRYFAADCIRGEWFRAIPAILNLAAEHPWRPTEQDWRGESWKKKPRTALARYLVSKNLTVDDFAGQIGRSAASVSRLARGVQRPAWETVCAIVEATQGAVKANDFLPEEAA